MEMILNGLQSFVNLGSYVVLPFLVFVFGLLLGAKAKSALISGLTVGIGFIAINMVISLMSESLGPAAQEMVKNFGLSLHTIDIGGPAASAISYATLLGITAIPLGIIVNVVLLLVGLTKTLDVDIWNYWHGAFVASLVYAISGSIPMGVAATVVYLLMLYLFADILAPEIKKFYGFGNITFPHGTSAPGYFVALPLNWLFDRIPIFNKLNADAESIQKKFGVFGNTTVIGLLIGIVIGVLAGYDFTSITQLGMKTAAVMILMPKMVSLIMEGLLPISDSAEKFVKKRFPGRDLYIGMDSALSVGHPAVLSSSLVLIPITIFLAVVLPGNTTLPFAELAAIPFMVCLMAPAFKGNIIRMIFGGSIYMGMALYISSYVAPLITSAANYANFDLLGNESVTVLTEGGLWTTLVYVLASKYFGWYGIIILGLIILASLFYVNKIREKKNNRDSSESKGLNGG